MRVVLTAAAVRDLDDIRSYTATHFPTALPALDRRLRASLRRLGAWPESAPAVIGHPGVRMVPLIRYTCRIFRRVAPARAKLPHIHHAARRAP